jgi:hypothetical protein
MSKLGDGITTEGPQTPEEARAQLGVTQSPKKSLFPKKTGKGSGFVQYIVFIVLALGIAIAVVIGLAPTKSQMSTVEKNVIAVNNSLGLTNRDVGNLSTRLSTEETKTGALQTTVGGPGTGLVGKVDILQEQTRDLNTKYTNLTNNNSLPKLTVVTGNCNISVGLPVNLSMVKGQEDTFSIISGTTVNLSAFSAKFSGWLINGITNTNSNISLVLTGDTLVQAYTYSSIITSSLSTVPVSNTSWTVQCLARDSDNLSLNYTWGISGGSLSLATGNSSGLWTIYSPGTYWINCTVTNSYRDTDWSFTSVVY